MLVQPEYDDQISVFFTRPLSGSIMALAFAFAFAFASMVGVSRQFVNGALNHIKQAGLIELGKRRIVVTRLEDLREMSLLAPEGGTTTERESTRRSREGPREEGRRTSGSRSCTTA